MPARLNYIGNHANSVLEWLRMPGDIVFILGGTLPILYLSLLGIRYMKKGSIDRRNRRTFSLPMSSRNQKER